MAGETLSEPQASHFKLGFVLVVAGEFSSRIAVIPFGTGLSLATKMVIDYVVSHTCSDDEDEKLRGG